MHYFADFGIPTAEIRSSKVKNVLNPCRNFAHDLYTELQQGCSPFDETNH
jgi:hypothetical protein